MPQTRPRLEHLEDRCTPALWGNPWPDATHLTVSFAPDGTLVAGQNSTLFSTLASHPGWQTDILRALQTWAVQAGVNFSLVSDGGQALGVAGRPQGDLRFGDVRIAAGAFAKDVLIFSSPFDPTVGTASGDVRLNSAIWGDASLASRFDLYTAMLQEAGHVLGIGNSSDPASVMYEQYLGPRTGLSQGDIDAVQALYGARPADGYERATGNETLATATSLNLLKDSNGLLSLAANADLTTTSDRDVYSFQAPSLTGGLVIRLERSGLSLVTPMLTVLDASGRVVASTQSTDPTGGDLELRVNGVVPLGRYYVRVEGAGTDIFRVGSYRLTVQSLPLLNSLTNLLTSTVQQVTEPLLNDDLHLNDSFLTASLLPSLSATTSRFDYAYQGSIRDTWDVDYYRITVPNGVGNVMTVMAWGVGKSQLLPHVTVYDAAHNVVKAQVLVNEQGVVTVQFVGAQAGATYFVKVDAAVPSGTGAVGNYFLGIDFGTQTAGLQTFANNQLSTSKTDVTSQMEVRHTSLFHFVLSSESAGATGVQMTISDANGNLVAQIASTNGNAVSVTVTLAPGMYTFRLHAFASGGGALAPVAVRLDGKRSSDPIGPRAQDTTEDPSQSPSGGSTTTDPAATPPPDNTGQPPPADPASSNDEEYWYYWYSWDDGSSTSNGVPPQDPAGSGYSP